MSKEEENKETRASSSKPLSLPSSDLPPTARLIALDSRFSSLRDEFGEPPFAGPVQEAPEQSVSAAQRTVFGCMAKSIIYQQLAVKAARTILGRFAQIQEGRDFPEPSFILSAPDTALRSCGLSGPKTSYMKSLAENCINGNIPADQSAFADMSDEDVIRVLTKVKGIGVWSVHMFLMFTLCRLDIFPIGDMAVRKGFVQLTGSEPKMGQDEMMKYAERWKPYRSIAAWYMWRVLDKGKQKQEKTVLEKKRKASTDES